MKTTKTGDHGYVRVEFTEEGFGNAAVNKIEVMPLEYDDVIFMNVPSGESQTLEFLGEQEYLDFMYCMYERCRELFPEPKFDKSVPKTVHDEVSMAPWDMKGFDDFLKEIPVYTLSDIEKDFINDWNADKDRGHVDMFCKEAVAIYLGGLGACQGAMDAFSTLWDKYTEVCKTPKTGCPTDNGDCDMGTPI